jgi:hypothetical protein
MSLFEDAANFRDDVVGFGVGDADRFGFAINKKPQYFFGRVPLSIPTLDFVLEIWDPCHLCGL